MDTVLADFVLDEIVDEFYRSQLPDTGFRNLSCLISNMFL